MARQPTPAFKLYEQQSAPQPNAAPPARPQDVSSGMGGIAQSLSRAGAAVQNYQETELEVARIERARRLDDARIDVTRRMAEFRRDANTARRETFDQAPDGWRDGTSSFSQRYNALRDERLADATLTPEAREMFEDQLAVFEPGALDAAAEQEYSARGQWQADATRQAVEAGGSVLVTDPGQYDAVREDALETLGAITDPNMRRDATEAMEESYARYAVGGLIQADPRGALRALRADDREGAYARLSPAALAQGIQEAQNEINRRRAVYVSQLRDRMSVESDMMDVDLTVDNPVSVEQVRAAMGDNAARAWDIRLRASRESTAMRSATVPDLLAVRNEAPDTSSLEARTAQIARQQAAEQQLTTISNDPAGYLVRSGAVPETPDLDEAFTQAIQNPDARIRTASGPQSQLSSFLRARAAAATTATNQRGIPPRVFTEDEANRIAGRLRSHTAVEQASVLRQIHTALGSGQLYEVALEQITPGGGASRVAGHYIDTRNGGNVIAGRILEGQALISGAPTPDGERRQNFTLPSEDRMRDIWGGVTGAGAQNVYRGQPEAERGDFAAFQALYASEASRAGRFNGDIETTIARNAANQIINKTQWSGRNIMMPPGYTSQSFGEAVRRSYSSVASRGGDLDGQSADDFDLAPYGNGRYQLMVGDTMARDAQNNPVFVSVPR